MKPKNRAKSQKPPGTRTISYMTGTNPRRGFDGITTVPTPTGSAFPSALVRKSMWKPIEKCDYDPGKLAELIARTSDRTLFFLDNSLFDTETDQRVWGALLGVKRRLALSAHVRQELQPWIDRNPDHVAARAVVGNAQAFLPQVGFDTSDPPTVAAAKYYISLLEARKQLFSILDRKFESEYGRSPTIEEAKRIRADVNNTSGFGPRAHLLAKKGENDSGSPNYFTDENLVTLAAFWGLERSRDIVLLTKDEDLLEQHYKLLYLMDTHYRGMLLAERYKDDPRGLTVHELPKEHAALSEAFALGDGFLIERTDRMAEELLPRATGIISLHCIVAGDQFTQLSFAACAGMRQLLSVKGRTGGLNTDLFDGRNCHYWLAPLSLPKGSPEIGCAIIARDVLEGEGTSRLPLLDLNQALTCVEHFKQLHYKDETVASAE